jgi:hypothetical protein
VIDEQVEPTELEIQLDQIASALLAASFDLDPIAFADTLWAASLYPWELRSDRIGRGAGAIAVQVVEPDLNHNDGGIEPHDDNGALFKAGDQAKSQQPFIPTKHPTQQRIFVGPEQQEPSPSGIPVSPINVPVGTAIPGGLEIVRALRAIPGRRASRTEVELDTASTVEATAENNGRLTLRLAPVMERWFEAAIVVEQTPSVEIWSETVVELERLLQYAGVFRDVRLLYLDLTGEPRLILRGGQTATPKTLCDPVRSRIVMLFGTGVSRAWTDGTMGEVLSMWSSSAPVVLVHALPESMWPQTRLGRPPAVVETASIGTPNAGLACQPAFWARRLRLDFSRQPLPVVAIDPKSVKRWSEFIAQRRRGSAKTFLIARRAHAAISPNNELAGTGKPVDVETRIHHLAATAPRAYRLASILAGRHFGLPLARLVIRALFGPRADNQALAELMLSGIVERIQNSSSDAPFRFVRKASQMLVGVRRVDDALQVSRYVEQNLQESSGVGSEVYAFIEDLRGRNRLPSDIAELAAFTPRERFTQPDRPLPAVRRTYDPSVMAKEVLAGRDMAVMAADEDLQKRHCIIISGAAGIGKSMLARAVARRAAPRYDIVWRIDAGTEAGIFSSVNKLRATLHLPVSGNEIPKTPLEVTQLLVDELGRTKARVLLIADDLSFPWLQDIFNSDWLGMFSRRFGAILTARASRRIPESVGVHRLQPLLWEDARRFLHAESERPDIHIDELATILQLVGTSPSALRFAATTLKHFAQPVQTYIAALAAFNESRNRTSAATNAEPRTTLALLGLIEAAEQLQHGVRLVFFAICSFGNDLVPKRLLQDDWPFGFDRVAVEAAATLRQSPASRSSTFSDERLAGDDGFEFRRFDASTIDSALAVLEEIGIVAAEAGDALRIPRFASMLVRDHLHANGISWWRPALNRIAKAFDDAAGDHERSELIPIAAFVLDRSSMFELQPNAVVASSRAVAQRAELAIDFGSFACSRAQAQIAETFARHAAASLSYLRPSGSDRSSLEYRYKLLRKELAGMLPQTRVAASDPVAPVGTPLTLITDEDIRQIGRSRLGTSDIQVMQLLATRTRETWLVSGAGSVIFIAHEQSTGSAVVQWQTDASLALPVRVNASTVRLGKDRRVKYSRKLHPNFRELKQRIKAVLNDDRAPRPASLPPPSFVDTTNVERSRTR